MNNASLLDRIVTGIISNMSEADKADLLNIAEADLIQFHHNWGRRIRNKYNLWQDKALLEGLGADHPDDASMKIIKTVWKRLN